MPQLEFAWNPQKARSNLAKHGVSFAQAASVLHDALALTVFDEAHSNFEERWFTLGLASDGKLLAVSHTHDATGPDSAKVRIISAREATKAERRHYEQEPR
ncbi:MAG TPA: BrnT family toxin [Ideonella sp.]|uniref:BrnT family toxin n=1 Tax=Ideonella sp. TaxID=1929293 RepID=UPI002C8F75A5|nr:BrnT family toxin [Ideonella sp.]HSI51355.1 BrnT family toxin [Ideonella sp.]